MQIHTSHSSKLHTQKIYQTVDEHLLRKERKRLNTETDGTNLQMEIGVRSVDKPEANPLAIIHQVQ